MSGQILDVPHPTPSAPLRLRPAARPMRRLPSQADWPAGQTIAVQCGLFVGLVLLWEVGARLGVVDVFFWSQPSSVAETLLVFFSTGTALVDIRVTFTETILGFVLGTSLGAAIGLSFWWSRNWARVLQPYIVIAESIPKLALAPLIILVFGLGLASKVAIATALTLIVTTITTHGGVKAIDPDGERLFYSLGASRRQVFLKFVVPSCLPWIISILRVNIGLALTGAVVGEFIASERGLGRTIFYAGQTYEIALVWVAVLVLATLSVARYVAVAGLERYLGRKAHR